MSTRRRPHARRLPAAGLIVVLCGALAAGLGAALLALVVSVVQRSGGCGSGVGGVVLGPPGSGQRVGATEYGGPGDPSSGTDGASGQSLLAHPDSYAELGGDTFQTATAMGGLPYMTPLRITWGRRSAIAYKRDFGLGGGPIEGLPRVIDLWWQLAGRLGIPYEHGLWSGPVRIERPPATGAGSLLGQLAAPPRRARRLSPAWTPAPVRRASRPCLPSPPATGPGFWPMARPPRPRMPRRR